jgi:hypothetical protein
MGTDGFKEFLEKLGQGEIKLMMGDTELSKALLNGAGVTEVHDSPKEGRALAEITPDEMREFSKVRDMGKDCMRIEAEIKRLQANLNAKVMIYKGMSDIWWNDINAKYPEVNKASCTIGAHIDESSMTIKSGMMSNKYKFDKDINI